MDGPLVFGILVALATMVAFVGLWRFTNFVDPVEARMKEYGMNADTSIVSVDGQEFAAQKSTWSVLSRLLNRLTFGPRLAADLTKADLPLTVAEFVILIFALGSVGFLVGSWRLGALGGLIFGIILGYAPLIYLRRAQKQRQKAFTAQLSDVLTLLVGALKAGYGLTQALQVPAEQLAPPASQEFSKVIRAIGLGVSVQQALRDMVDRIGTEDAELVVTAINVQHEVGGNLAETLATIAETIRDRIRIQREIGVLTAEERMTGYILAGLPVVLALVLFTLNPEFMSALLAPGWIRILPVVAVLMQLAGLWVIQKIISIEV
ncbi:MAG: hypothetical protein A2Y73_05750 [Chloroflexi bacterium RBG_13_56_8]|nr:MAG: hypothetical protein A2Y73_05750 [Chloroflexi bacterium RBG_13_56_8]